MVHPQHAHGRPSAEPANPNPGRDAPESPDSHQFEARKGQWAVAVAVFCLVTVLYTFPLVLHIRDSTLQLGLNYAVMANARIIGEQLASGSSPLESDRILAPTGYTIHEGFLPSLMVYLLGMGQDPLLGLNLSVLLSFVLAALGAWALAFALTGSAPGALAAGFFYGFCAIHFANYPIYPIVHIEWIPWFLYAQIRYFQSDRNGYLGVAGLAFVAASLCSWYFTVFLLLTGLLLTVSYAWSRRDWPRVRRFALAMGIACLLLIPFSPIVLLGRSGVDAGGFRFVVDASADLLSLFVPPWYHWLFGPRVWKLASHWLGNSSLWGNYLGTFSLGLALWGLLAGRGIATWVRRALLAVAGMGLILALGPFLVINGLNGWTVSDPVSSIQALRLPYYWLADIFPFSATRATARYLLLTILVLSVGLALGVARAQGRRPSRRILVGLGVAAILLLELWPYWPSRLFTPLEKSPVYGRLAGITTPGSLLELPFKTNSYRILDCSTWHDLTVIGGAIDKPFARFRQHALGYPFLRELLLARPDAGGDAPPSDIFGSDPEQDADAVIRDLRIDYAVVHRWDESVLSFGDYFVEEPLKDRMVALLAPYFRLESEDDQVLLFKSTVPPGPWLYSTLGEGWGGVEPHGDHVERVVLGSSAEVGIHSSDDRTVDVDLELAVILVPERDLTLSLDGSPILTKRLARRSSATDFKSIRLTGVQIHKGVNHLEIRTTGPVPSIADVYGGNDHRPIAFVVKRLQVGAGDGGIKGFGDLRDSGIKGFQGFGGIFHQF